MSKAPGTNTRATSSLGRQPKIFTLWVLSSGGANALISEAGADGGFGGEQQQHVLLDTFMYKCNLVLRRPVLNSAPAKRRTSLY